jgi:hypothetical protein
LTANHLTEVDGSAVITDDDGGILTLNGTTIADLTQDTFLF